MSRTLEIATAIASTIDAASFAWASPVEVGFRIRKALEDLPGPLDLMAVTVQPDGKSAERTGRPGSPIQTDHEFVLEFARKVDVQNTSSDPTVIGAMVEWVDLATNYLFNNALTGDTASVIGVEVETPFDAVAFDEQHVFYSRSVVTVRDMR